MGTIQRKVTWPLRKDDTHKSRSVNNFLSETENFAFDAEADNFAFDAFRILRVAPKQRILRLTHSLHYCHHGRYLSDRIPDPRLF